MINISTLKNQLSGVIEKIDSSKNNSEINSIVENLITDITDSEFASIWVYEFPLLSRKRGGITKEISIEPKEGLLYKCFITKQAVIYNYLSSEKGYVASIDNPDNIRIKSKIMIPLMQNDKFIGIATAYSSVKKIKKFTNDDLDIFKAVAPFIIDSIHKMQKNSSNNNPFQEKNTQDLENNLNKVQELQADTKAPSEILDYVSSIVHDIRTPANGLIGFLEILQEQLQDDRLKKYVGHARKSALLINELTTSILDTASAKREPSSKEPTLIDTVKFFSDIAEVFSANMSQKRINYNIFIDPLLPKNIELNSMKTKRVVMNLISNASKFTPENGSIEFSVRYRQKEQKLHVFVKDSGIGIAKDKQEEIFEAFKQAESDTKDKYGGTGLGLAICSVYVKEMGGELSIDSTLNKGSTFYFDIPMEIQAYPAKFEPILNDNIYIAVLLTNENSFVANHIARYFVKIGVNVDRISAITDVAQITDKVSHIICFEKKLSDKLFLYIRQHSVELLVVEENFLTLKSKNLLGATLISQYTYFADALYNFVDTKEMPKVLIVEDDAISIELLKTMFSSEYCKIDVANNGMEGLELLAKALNKGTPYDIVYTDHNMPLLSGSEMLREYNILEKERGVSKSIATVSVSGDIDNTKDLYDFDFFATKPFKKQEILSIFSKTIQIKRSH